MMYALADCNNFYATCERVFQPRLERRPVIVLSNNDGCVVARSQEAKDLGIRMGQPVFQCRDLIKQHGVVVRSSNYALYEDMSRRVVATILECIPDVEIYSIDEVFCDLAPMMGRDPEQLCRMTRARVLQWTGVPVSIGIGPTKTLAKVANRIAKKNPEHESVYRMPEDTSECHRVLSSVAIDDVWGIGHRWGRRFRQMGVETALDLVRLPPRQVRARFNIIAMHTALELAGVPCNDFDPTPAHRRTLVRSRSFGKMVEDQNVLSQAIASHATRAAEKLRLEGGVAGRLMVFIQTNRFREDLPQRSVSGSCELLPATSTTPVILNEALQIGRKLWKPGFAYKKAGVMLSELAFGEVQGGLFAERDEARDSRLMQIMDQINARMGSGSLHPAASGLKRRDWAMRQDHRSPRYTTRWSELPRTV